MAAYRWISLSKVSPKYLHSNSTSHTWAFSAIANLIDNAYDPDVSASELRIDVEEINGQTCLTFVDNGEGLDPDKLLKMLSFGFCEKDEFDNKKGFHAPIGSYGNGFKSGSMRLGKDAMVLSRQKSSNSMSVGLLSQTYLAAIGAETVLVPIVTWRLPERQTEGDTEKVRNNMEDMLRHSVFRTEEELLSEFDKLHEFDQSTKIIIYNLHTLQSGATELDLGSDPTDIRCSESQELDHTMVDRAITTAPEYCRSLRVYCSILFLKPRMKIYVRGGKVRTRPISKSLSRTGKDVYRPSWLNKEVTITFGFSRSQRHEEEYGLMMYHRNRLIKAYEKIGYQKQSNNEDGMIGIVEVDFLRPTHNKQDFIKDEKYCSLIQALSNKLNDYWKEQRDRNRDYDTPSREKDETWIKCNNCQKWRRLPGDVTDASLPDRWFCYMNPDVTHNRCDVEDENDSDEENLSSEDPLLWAQCDRCEKWRRLPDGISKDSLPDKWYCFMNPDATHNRCDVEEEPQDESLSSRWSEGADESLSSRYETEEESEGADESPSRERKTPLEKQRKQQQQQQQQQLQQQYHHLGQVAAEDSVRKIGILMEKLRESRQREEEQKRRILEVEQQKTLLEEDQKLIQKLVRSLRVMPLMEFNLPAQNGLTLPDNSNNSSNDGRSSSSRRGTGNDSDASRVIEGLAAEIRELRLKLKNTETELAEARKQAENTKKELAEARKQAEDTEKKLEKGEEA